MTCYLKSRVKCKLRIEIDCTLYIHFLSDATSGGHRELQQPTTPLGKFVTK